MTRRIEDQVAVITGASSGVGRETALELARRGCSLVLAARAKTALDDVGREVERIGGQALPVVTDVADWAQVQQLGDQAMERFGRIDTWINVAAISTYGMVEQLEVEEIERVIQVNLLGQIYGMKAALARMGDRPGTIINVASAEALRAIPLQAPYVASKHGIKGFTEALRMELKHAGRPTEVVLVLPSSINTPLFTHARSKIGAKPQPVPPIYEPSVVAQAIVAVAEKPRRDVVVGGAGKMLTLLERISPALGDWYMLRNGKIFKQQRTDEPDDGRDNLFEPMPDTDRTTGSFGQRSKSSSIYTQYLDMHPNRGRAAVLVAVLGLLLAVRRVGR